MDIKLGRKIEPDQAKRLDRSKMAVMIRTPPEQEVEGQAPTYAATQCPWCGSVGYTWIDTDHWTWVLCGYCGQYFEA
ncbi:MAG: hypothetical protein AAFX39_14835 [Pseudomonadota bacterium]